MAAPNFDSKIAPVDPTAVASLFQRKAQIEGQQQEDRFKQLMEAVQTGQSIASNMMDIAAKQRAAQRQKSMLEGAQKVSDLLQPEPSTAETSTMGQVPVRPTMSPEQRNGALIAALIQSDPQKGADIALKSIVTPAKQSVNADNLEPDNVLYNGQPARVLRDKQGNYYSTVTKQLLTGDIKPYNPSTDTSLTDEDRKRLAPLAKAVIEGRASPTALVGMRGNERSKLSQVTAEIDPNFDLSLAPQRVAVRKDFSPSGKTGQTLTSLNTVIGHMDTLSQKFDALDNKNVTAYNTIGNYLNKNVGKPEVSGVIASKNFVQNELAKVAQGSGVITDSERKELANALDSSSSPAQAKEVINTWMDIIKSRTDAIKSNWSQTMGDLPTPVPVINDKSKKILTKYGYDPVTLEKKQVASSDPSVDALASALGLKKRKS